MPDFFVLMWKPLLAAVILTGIHAYLGYHVIERKVVFVDLSLAQIAALGASAAFLIGYELHSVPSYLLSLLATFLGAVIFAATRTRYERIPQEAVIGIVYAVSSALAIMVLSRSPEGDEHIRHMLTGNILLVTSQELLWMCAIYGLVGLFHWKYRRIFFAISSAPGKTFAAGMSVRFWDLMFYLSFGLVVTSSVEIAGVLLVFSFLIVPSVVAMLFSNGRSARLWIGWAAGIAASVAGIAASYAFDFPTGPSIVCAFGLLFLFAGLWRWKFL